jgi:hypothetical protein
MIPLESAILYILGCMMVSGIIAWHVVKFYNPGPSIHISEIPMWKIRRDNRKASRFVERKP